VDGCLRSSIDVLASGAARILWGDRRDRGAGAMGLLIWTARARTDMQQAARLFGGSLR
jgi:hypothetical protein